jgi:hypothetical protein
LLEYEFKAGKNQKTRFARLGFPRPIKDDEWVCSFQLEGWKEGKIKAAHGVDGLQALLIASDAIRRALEKMKGVTPCGDSFEFVFPRIVPSSYGPDFHWHLCGILDKEIAKKERQLSRRRLARKRRKQNPSA